MSLLNKYRETTDLNRFLIKGLIFFGAWRGFHKWYYMNEHFGKISDVLAIWYLNVANFFLKLFGIKTGVSKPECKLWVEGASDAVQIIYDCLGINIIAVFVIFIFAYPGKIRTKAWFIPAGLVAIFFLNAMRMSALTIIVDKWPHLMDLFHHFIFQGIIYVFVFAFWYWFISLSKKK